MAVVHHWQRIYVKIRLWIIRALQRDVALLGVIGNESYIEQLDYI
jgi:hypothetical protein